MARKKVVEIYDDLDGQIIEKGDARVARFAFEGAQYELDTSVANYESLRDRTLGELLDAARKVSSQASSRRGGTGEQITALSATGASTREVREWAQENGHVLSDRGRIPREILAAYVAAH
ncbi:Lsr2 family protein [Gordonia malaquae]|uniref:histone-like nucleoid-structuring protein Lsr2 n=1 Tax=Gordonia malaquae TaxID=410332 RepID=UPI00301961F2